MEHPYWRRQTTKTPLFPDIDWSRPEQRAQAGRLGIIGGNKLNFVAVAESYTTSLEAGIGQARALVPDALKASIPPVMTDVSFAPSNPSGSLARAALDDMLALGSWASIILLIGDAGRNSETAIAYEDFLRKYVGPLVVTRDAIDLVKNSPEQLVNRPDTLLVLSFAQLQKLFSSVYYPKVLVFSMQLTQLVEAVHKFTITYPISLCVLHQQTLVVASSGEVTTSDWDNPMAIWRGETATRASVYYAWNPKRPLEAITASLVTTPK